MMDYEPKPASDENVKEMVREALAAPQNAHEVTNEQLLDYYNEESKKRASLSPLEEGRQNIQLRKAELVATEQSSFFNPVVYAQMKQMATDFIASKAVPKGIDNAEQLIMVFQAGYEMGMKPVEAMSSLYIVNGKITPWGPAVLRQVRKAGFSISFSETPASCSARVTKVGRLLSDPNYESYTDTFTLEMAEKSGYVKDSYGKDRIGWKEGANRVLKLRYGAISNIVKTFIPEVLGGYAGIAELEMDAVENVDGRKPIAGAIEKYRKDHAENGPSVDFQDKAED